MNRETEMHQAYMRLALQEARLAMEKGEIPVGAVLVRNGEILARCHNLRETLHDPTAHAEMLCLREASLHLPSWHMRDCTLYVTLEPCPMCCGALILAQTGLCVFGAPDPKKGCCGSVYDFPHDPALQSCTRWECGILEEECRSLLQTFFRGQRH